MGKLDKEADASKEPKKVARETYLVKHSKNFGNGMIAAGKTVELNEKAATHYLDLGIITKIKTKK